VGVKKAKMGAKGPRNGAAERSELHLTAATRRQLYAARRYLGLDAMKELGLRLPVEVYFKDPRVAEVLKEVGIDDEFTTPWEPGLMDGPTSARFAVVDYDATNNTLTPPAVWNAEASRYEAPDGTILDRNSTTLFQYHQLFLWATVQNTLDFFESGFGLRRRISWAFGGNRLILVPHAGFGENAYYDRASKSLQLYWFDVAKGRVYTCLSSDIVNHEFGHAVLDGLRPYYYESLNTETAAFHEFIGDLTAVLMAFRNNAFRKHVLKESSGDLDNDQLLGALARQFGEAVRGEPYLRTASDPRGMKDLAGELEPHMLSVVMTGAMFDILKLVFRKHRDDQAARVASGHLKRPSDLTALAQTVPRMQLLAIQPLDLLPPCAVTFRDYALAVLRSEQVANPTDPQRYRELMMDVFVKRGILTEQDAIELMKPSVVFTRPALDVFHPIEAIAASRGGAYRFLDDNRAKLLIPRNADVEVAEIVRAGKYARDGRLLPEQIVLQYIWREELALDGERFGRFAGAHTTMLCGATMVLDQNGNLIHWVRKPGSAYLGNSKAAKDETAEGVRRRIELLDTIAARVAAGMIGETIGGELGLLERASPPFGVEEIGGTILFTRAPHFSIDDEVDDGTGGRKWQISF
jgi:hypothetical protein